MEEFGAAPSCMQILFERHQREPTKTGEEHGAWPDACGYRRATQTGIPIAILLTGSAPAGVYGEENAPPLIHVPMFGFVK